MRYGKISNGELIYAPTNYEIEDGSIILNFNKDQKALKKYGYKEVVEALRPPYPYVITYKETATKITEIVERDVEKEKEIIAMNSLTRGDVFRGLLQAKGVTRAQLRAMIETNEALTEVQKEMALIDFDEALNFYRGNALIDTVGFALGITSAQLDKFFESNDYKDLVQE